MTFGAVILTVALELTVILKPAVAPELLPNFNFNSYSNSNSNFNYIFNLEEKPIIRILRRKANKD